MARCLMPGQVLPYLPPPPLPTEPEDDQPPPAPLLAPLPLCTCQDERTDLMVSGRFNDAEMVAYIKSVRDILIAKGVPIFMVDTQGPGDAFGVQTVEGLYKAKALLAFCGTNYGQRTGAGYETYVELRYAHDNKLEIIPIQLCDTFPPQPPDLAGRAQNHVVLRPDLMRVMDTGMNNPLHVADEIHAAWTRRLQHLRVHVKPYC
ncbi:unnamed protein product [Symbiodinium necroappetens]|uniref:TIR domain-containing protein n=1 Tax=Symbiodinium necroappetens TaxID=1628268 RepID=A0A812RNS1_9DINO|nr:unnamed protein product [Symbiodinium necroappetens]